MRRIIICGLLCLAVATWSGCSREESPTAPNIADAAHTEFAVDPELVAGEIVVASGWTFGTGVQLPEKLTQLKDKTGICHVLDFERELIADGIAHYSWNITLGDGPYETVGLHRVVRERRPGVPSRSRESLFMLHGSGVGFRASFLTSTIVDYIPPDHALPVLLAENGIDVWGIDAAWTFIPPEETDFSFAADWGLARELDDLEAGLVVARLVRLFTGSGACQLNLLGWSRGESVGYAYLDREAQRPRRLRHIKGFIPVDSSVKTDFAPESAFACATAASIEEARANGIYVDSLGALASYAAYLAIADPDGDSPIFPGLPNRIVPLIAVTQTFVLGSGIPHYHLLAGVFDTYGLPVDLQNVPAEFAVDFYAAWSPYDPNLALLEIAQITCGDTDSPFDDHFGDIEVPIFYIGAGGSGGSLGEYMATQVASCDFQSLVVSTDANPFLDFGHVDLFVAFENHDARPLVWEPILTWINEHSEGTDSDSPVALGDRR
jgi:hypothetical protein